VVAGWQALAQTRHVEWPAADDHAIHGQLTVPAGDPRRAALVVEPHGGSQCADDSSFASLGQPRLLVDTESGHGRAVKRGPK
jgi:dipeptidyl aminopeptidase/acylaminoacyl peptidase